MNFKQFLLENTEALEFINDLIITGGPSSGKKPLSSISRKWLQDTVIKNKYKLYRGIGLIPSRIDKSNIEEINNLKVGDILPNILFKKYNKFASYTKKKSVAKYYSEGKLSIIVQAEVPKKSIISDLENLNKIVTIEQDILDEEDFDYFKSDKEVIVEEPIEAKIIFIKGQL